MNSTTEQLNRMARQNIATDRLLGVDFAPIVASTSTPRAATATVTEQSAAPTSVFAVETKPTDSSTTPRGTPAEKLSALDELRVRHDQQCPHCTTATGHTQTVFGEGSADAQLMFIGEAPGQQEDLTGRPFVGRAGQKLDDMIKAMGLKRDDVYIANVLKSRPPDNRTPLQSEVDQCGPFLAKQIRIIAPAVLVTLGGPATKLILNTNVGITRLRGVWAQYTDPDTGRVTPVMPTFHPAYLLRAYTPDNRKKVWSDMQAVMQQLGLAG